MSSICEKEGSGYNRQTMLNIRLIGRMVKGIILISLHFHNYMTGDINTQRVGYTLTNHMHKWGFLPSQAFRQKKLSLECLCLTEYFVLGQMWFRFRLQFLKMTRSCINIWLKLANACIYKLET